MHRFLFILSPPNSGSTALVRLVETSPNVSILPSRKGEGQFILTVAPIMRFRPWDEGRRMPWRYIRWRWMRNWDLSKPILLEKSPANIVRAPELREFFQPASFIISIRNPYAFCEGVIRRRHQGRSHGWAAEFWLECAEFQRRNVQELQASAVMTRYEDFTEDPAETVRKIMGLVPELGSLDGSASMEVHSLDGSVQRPLTNLNDKQIRRLSPAQIGEITEVLNRRPDLLEFFRYSLL